MAITYGLSRGRGRARVGLALLALAGPAWADPGYYLTTPYDQQGRVGIELRYWTVKPRDDSAYLWPELALSYGLNSRWTTRVYANWSGESLREQSLASLNWQNVFLITQGERPYDLALHLQFTRNVGEGNAVEAGPVWQTDLGRLRLNANAIWAYDSARRDTSLKLQWRSLLRLQPGWRAGVLGFDELGRWNHWAPASRQSHRAGPALVAELIDTDRCQLELQAAFLFGKTFGERGDMFSTQLAFSY
jgi:hypothetical protein